MSKVTNIIDCLSHNASLVKELAEKSITEKTEIMLRETRGQVAKEILKDCNLYKNAPTLIACPTCGRIQYDLIPIANEIEEFLQTIKAPITVAVMGCGVNGPNEARHADIGIAGGIKEGLLFKKGEIIRKVKQEDIVKVLKEEILKMI